MPRAYPALELRWNRPPGEGHLDRLFAAIDDDRPTAIEERDDGRVRVFFGTDADRQRAAARLHEVDPDLECAPLDVSDEDWAARSQAGLGPVQVGRIVVTDETDTGCRFSEEAARKPTPGIGFVRISITPSMGFGTGHHASTRRCLALLQRVPVEGARVLDAGTGSGVLAIAAWKLGAREVVAADSDIDALTAARENLVRNRATDAIHLGWIDLAELPAAARPGASFDLVLANLTGGALIRFASLLAAQLGPAGRVIASGFQEGEVAPVAEAFARAGLTETDRDVEDGWVGATFRQES